MKTLFVIYDSECGFCCRCRQWLMQQPAFLDLRFVPRNSPEVACRFPGIEKLLRLDELLVVTDEGAVYWGAHAWVMCLYALCEYREWASKLAHPSLLPFARQAYELFSGNRREFSRWMKLLPEEEIAERIRQQPPPLPCQTERKS